MKSTFARLRACLFGLGVVSALVVMPACGGSSSKPPATSTGAVVESHEENALTRSAANTTAATSFSATLHADVDANGQTFKEDGVIVFRAPSAMYMKITIADQVIEVLADLPDEYINIPGKGWYSMGEYVVSGDAYAKYAKNRGPVDYAGIVNGLTDSRQLADEEIDGKRYLHYAGTFDISKTIDEVPKDLFKPGVASSIKALGFQPGTIDVWIDPDTNLPRRGDFDMPMKFADQTLQIHMIMDYAGWNEPVDMPDVPKDAKPYSELTGGLSPADVSYQIQCASWLLSVGKHMSPLAEIEKDPADMNDDERAQLRSTLDDIQSDISALDELQPTLHFRPSYDKFVEAMGGFKFMLDEIRKEIDSPGSIDAEAVGKAAEDAGNTFQEASDLFKQESSGKNP